MNKDVWFDLREELVHKLLYILKALLVGSLKWKSNISSMENTFLRIKQSLPLFQFITFDINYLLRNEIPKSVRLLRYTVFEQWLKNMMDALRWVPSIEHELTQS